MTNTAKRDAVATLILTSNSGTIVRWFNYDHDIPSAVGSLQQYSAEAYERPGDVARVIVTLSAAETATVRCRGEYRGQGIEIARAIDGRLCA